MPGFAALHLKHALQIHIPVRQLLQPSLNSRPSQFNLQVLATKYGRIPPSQTFSHASHTSKVQHKTPSLIFSERRDTISTLPTVNRAAQMAALAKPSLAAQDPSIDYIEPTMSIPLPPNAPIHTEIPVAKTDTRKNSTAGIFDPEANVDVLADKEEVKKALSRPPPVNSGYLPLPWKGRLGYACLNTYLRPSNPPIFCARTCRISSILENRHPLQDASQPHHRTKNRPDLTQPPDVERGIAYVQALGLANARDIVKMLRWNERYGIKFMRLSSEMFPFASHAEHGYSLEPFAADVLAEVGRVVAEFEHRLTVHPGQYTQLASPRPSVIENSVRDLEYHAEMLRLLKLPPQQDRDAVMVLHMGGVFGDKQATLDRFRQNYKTLSTDIKNRLVLENDDVSWTVHDLLPICEELNIPLVLDYHHHNINFDADKIREGTLDIMSLYRCISATWSRKGITQKMHYSEPTPGALTKAQRRKHNSRVQMLPPCDPTMDLMIEAKDKEQAVFELMRIYKLPGFEKINDIIPFTRSDDNKVQRSGNGNRKKKAMRKKASSTQRKNSVGLDNGDGDDEILTTTIPEEEIGMGGPEGRVYWPPGMEQWLHPEKCATSLGIAEAIVTKSSGSSVLTTTSAPPRKRSRSAKDTDTPYAKAAVEQPAGAKRRRARKTSIESSGSEDGAAAPLSAAVHLHTSHNQALLHLYLFLETSLVLAPPPFLRLRFHKAKPGLRLRTTFAFLRYLIPHTRNRIWTRFLDLRHDVFPSFRQRAHLRVYRAIANRRQLKLRHKHHNDPSCSPTTARTSGNKRQPGLLSFLLSKSRKGIGPGHRRRGATTDRACTQIGFDYYRDSRILGAISRHLRNVERGDRMMTPQSGPSGPYRDDPTSDAGSGYGYGYGQEGGGRERGARRKKIYGYLKAANELRQSYSAQWTQRNQDYDDDMRDVPGGFPDVETARYADEQLILFPSYGRRHVRKVPEVDYRDMGQESSLWTDPDDLQSTGNMKYWRREWEEYEMDNATVDVDVRGWIFAPHRGPMNRRNRILISLARRLSGIPAPNTSTLESKPTQTSLTEEALVEKQEQSIINKSQMDTDPEWRAGSGRDAAPSRAEVEQNSYYNTNEEIAAANAQLMERLQPFLNNPINSAPITVFFFNEKNSQSRTVCTNDGGHFSVRAALDFVPTHIRVLASENLSATEEVRVIEPTGISLISDIDDTIKHSGITSGAKEIFRNTFVRNLGDLTVLGVNEWYSKLADMDVRIHYVSNSPWQLYPLLKSFFSLAGLPPGSFHLKQYSGMLQGIFEPTTEKKRPTLERIMLDFPERRFILVGDSGEADLELYTELVLANPGRILGVFIRDVTTPQTSKFFDKSFTHVEKPLSRTPTSDPPPLPERSSEPETQRPNLPPGNYLERKDQAKDETSSAMNDLIGQRIGDEPAPVNKTELAKIPSNNRQAPPLRPSKPAALRSGAVEADGDKKDSPSSSVRRKPVPPLPEKPRSLSSLQSQGNPETSSAPICSTDSSQATRPAPPSRSSTRQSLNNQQSAGNGESYAAIVQDKITNIYNQLPSARSYWANENPPATYPSTEQAPPSRPATKQPPPPLPPPRRSTNSASSSQSTLLTQTTQPQPQSHSKASTAQDQRYGNISLSHSPSPSSQSPTPPLPSRKGTDTPPRPLSLSYSYTSPSTSPTPGPTAPTAATLRNKREEIWRRRWARAKDILDRQGVVLMSWRVGEDVKDVCMRLIERAGREGGSGK
ncbi:UV damage endonuclease UvdE [Paracoccidioides brasiliensis]|uniref:UV damage endonuclease UvdE n=1 Tax=Paracoccidioides brasiliensis TaxID=121759 RepID=A0A1D2JD78_PARBR|nr:UV damage endonuclease UvdE [Paracoccidioides brasiliensis]